MSRNTIARVCRSALQNNLRQVRERASGCTVAAVVKAGGYGHGLRRVAGAIAPHLDASGDGDLFAVATELEARQLRELGWKGRVLLLEGFANADGLEAGRALGTEFVIHHANQLEILGQKGGANGLACWLKIDTGMHRLGFSPRDASAARETLLGLGAENLVLMTHFACADSPDNPMTGEQIKLFDQLTSGWEGRRSLANSAAINLFPQSHADIVRPGIMLYGVSPVPGRGAASLGLQPAMTLRCELIAINQCRAGDTVGYGANYRCPEDMPVGVASIGYGDGYPRHAKNGTPVLVDGYKAELAGRVSMDMITIDLRGHPDAVVGSEVILWGSGLPIEDVAPWADAVPYQLICGVTSRVEFEEI